MNNNKLSEESIEIAKKLYNADKIYGSYLGKDGRLRVIIRKDNANKTISCPKLLMEVRLNKILDKKETIDHLDEEPLNNNYDNLCIKNLSEHAKEDVVRVNYFPLQCPICNNWFNPSKDQANSSKKAAGPFCSKKCIGVYGKKIQIKSIEKINRNHIDKFYFKNKYLK